MSAVEIMLQRELLQNIPYGDKLKAVHRSVQARFPDIERVAIALYDPASDMLKTFAHSTDSEVPLAHYDFPLADSVSLSAIAASRTSRVIHDLDVLAQHSRKHSRQIFATHYGSSYTVPFYDRTRFAGFIFLNAARKGYFTDQVNSLLDPFISVISFLTLKELEVTRTLCATIASVVDISSHRDPETGGHLQRMSRYARMIAQGIADQVGLDDETIEHIFLFAPLHDVGKIAIPDQILLKPGRLDEVELVTMRTHATKGREIIERLLENFNIGDVPHIDLLRHIVELHHETLDGEGYPYGLFGEAIPLEARIVAVADIFDALTSHRPYKQPWDNERAFEHLREQAGVKLDAACVHALVSRGEEVALIQENFADEYYG